MPLTLTRRHLLGWLGASGATALVAPAMPALAGPAIEPDDIRAPLHPSEVVIRPLDAFFAAAARDPRAMNACVTVARHFPAVKEWEITGGAWFGLVGKVGTLEIDIGYTWDDNIALVVNQRQWSHLPSGEYFRPDLRPVFRREYSIEPIAFPGGEPLPLDERVALSLQWWNDENATLYRDSLALFGGWRG